MKNPGKIVDHLETVVSPAPTNITRTEDSEVDPMATVAAQAPLTEKNKIRSDLEEYIPKPYLARALVCPDIEHPKGTPPHKHPDMTVLQRHVAFFDFDDDGIVYPWDVYRGCRSLGFSSVLSIGACIIIAPIFGYATSPGWIPSPLLPIYINNIHQGMHGSDSGVYDSEGRFVPVQFENMFSKYANTAPDRFTLGEILKMTRGQGDLFDLMGRIGNLMEWLFLYLLARDENGFLSKEDIRCVYDGSLFDRVADMQHGHSQ